MTTMTKRDVCLWSKHNPNLTVGEKVILTIPEGTVEFAPMNGANGWKPVGGSGLAAWKKMPYGSPFEGNFDGVMAPSDEGEGMDEEELALRQQIAEMKEKAALKAKEEAKARRMAELRAELALLTGTK